MKKKQPLISIMIPCRNEEKYIANTINSILVNDYPKNKMEIFIIDGMSDDTTLEIIKDYIKKYHFIKLIKNIEKTVPNALNMGIKRSKGNFIIISGAHSIYPENYLSILVSEIIRLNADCIGGMLEIIPSDESINAQIIAVLMSSFFSIGNVAFRIFKGKNIIEVDTVPFGCYPKEIFTKVGLFDEEFVRNQDDEFNLRLKKVKGKIFLIPAVKINYFARNSFLKLFQLYYQYGYWKPKVIIKHKAIASIRHIIPPLFVVFILSIPGIFFFSFYKLIVLLFFSIYFLFILTGSLYEIKKNKLSFLVLFKFLFGFFGIHFNYGFGFLKGIIYFGIFKKKYQDFKLSR